MPVMIAEENPNRKMFRLFLLEIVPKIVAQASMYFCLISL